MVNKKWIERATKLSLRTNAFIDGKFVAAASGKRFDTINPATGRATAGIAECDAEDVERAVKAARAAFAKGSWSRTAPIERKKRLMKFGELVESHSEEIALLETLDMGAPISDVLSVALPKSAVYLRWFGEAIDKLYGEIAPTGSRVLALMRRDPLGVVGAVVPWNYPLFMAVWKFAPILAAGNSVVLKP